MKFNVNIKFINNFLESIQFALSKTLIKLKEKLFKIIDESDYIILHTALIENVDIFL